MPEKPAPSISPAVRRGAHLEVSPRLPVYAGANAAMAPSRAALCAALDAISGHRDAVTVVGAHAVLERTRDLDLTANATKDGDLALTPALVADEPHLDTAMRMGGFQTLAELEQEARQRDPRMRQRYAAQPGLWGTGMTADGEPVGEIDLLVPTSIAGGGRRSAHALKRHGKHTTRHTPALSSSFSIAH